MGFRSYDDGRHTDSVAADLELHHLGAVLRYEHEREVRLVLMGQPSWYLSSYIEDSECADGERAICGSPIRCQTPAIIHESSSALRQLPRCRGQGSFMLRRAVSQLSSSDGQRSLIAGDGGRPRQGRDAVGRH